MLLAIDAGNTNTVFAVFDGTTRKGAWRAATEARRTADEYGVWLEQVMRRDKIDPQAIDQAIIASVVPSATFNLSRLCTERFSSRPLIIGEMGVYLGIEVLLDRPEDVGADRLVNAVAAFDAIGGPLIVVDFGTATTFDVVDGDGNYRGGSIAPGVNLSAVEVVSSASVGGCPAPGGSKTASSPISGGSTSSTTRTSGGANATTSRPGSRANDRDSSAAARCVVPKLHAGATLKSTRKLLAERHCRLGRVYHAKSRKVRPGHLLALRARAGARLNNDAAVAVVVAEAPSAADNHHRGS